MTMKNRTAYLHYHKEDLRKKYRKFKKEPECAYI